MLFEFIMNHLSSVKRSNPGISLIVATVKGDLSVQVEHAIQNLGSHVSILYWNEFKVANNLRERFALNWVSLPIFT